LTSSIAWGWGQDSNPRLTSLAVQDGVDIPHVSFEKDIPPKGSEGILDGAPPLPQLVNNRTQVVAADKLACARAVELRLANAAKLFCKGVRLNARTHNTFYLCNV
jgi:hypothetical protein